MIGRIATLLALFERRDLLRFGVVIALMVGAAGLELVGLGAVPVFVAVAADPANAQSIHVIRQASSWLDLNSPPEILIAGSLALIAFFALRTLYLVGSYYVQDRIIRNREVALSSRLFQAYMQAPYVYHLKRNSAEIMRNATQEVPRVITEVLNPVLMVARHGIVMIMIMVLVVWVEPLLGVVTFAYMGMAGLGFLALVNNTMKRYGIMEQRLRGHQVKTVGEGLAILKELRLYGRVHYFLRQFHHNAEDMARPQRFRDTARRSTWPTMELIVVAGLLLVAVAMIGRGRPLDSVMPTLALFTVALARLKGCSTEFVSSLSQMRYHLASVDVVANELRELEKLANTRDDREREPDGGGDIDFKQSIRLDHVTFRYSDDREAVIRDVSLDIRRGSSVGFVGPTGAGKTTLVDMLIGLIEPRTGAVLVDDREISRQPESWQRHVGYIPQTIVLLDDTVARNIALGVSPEELDHDALARAVTAAQLDETVAALPEGLRTEVGERGVRLSGGQRQRVGIARALYRNPDVLVMDEGTSALDSETERAVVGAIEALKGDRTVITIAHRLSTVRRCDRLFLVEHGEVTAAGTYEELLASSPAFRRLAGAGAESR